jgi:hypothetical protein
MTTNLEHIISIFFPSHFDGWLNPTHCWWYIPNHLVGDDPATRIPCILGHPSLPS